MRTREEVEKLFTYEHLPAHLQEASRPFFDAACKVFDALEPSAERTLSLRKLWEAKNYAVWCAANTGDAG